MNSINEILSNSNAYVDSLTRNPIIYLYLAIKCTLSGTNYIIGSKLVVKVKRNSKIEIFFFLEKNVTTFYKIKIYLSTIFIHP